MRFDLGASMATWRRRHPFGGGRGDVFGEELDLTDLLFPRHHPLAEELGEPFELALAARAALPKSCWRAGSFTKGISAPDSGRSPIANGVIRSRCARRTSKRRPRRPRTTRSDRPAPPTSIGR